MPEGANEPRYPTLIAIKRAKQEIKKVTLAEPAHAAAQNPRHGASQPAARAAGVRVASAPKKK